MKDRLEIKVEKKLTEIAEYFLNHERFQEHIGLYGGDIGIALFLAMYYKYTNDERYFNKLNLYINHIIGIINKGNNIMYSFSRGLAGWGWLVEFLKQEELIDIDTNSFLQDIDQVQLNSLIRCIKQNKFDQLHEAISITQYFMKRNKPDPVITMLNALNETKIEEKNEIKWIRYDSYRDVHIYDFGLAHGIAGNLYFLSKCYKMNILPELCISLINGIHEFYKNNAQSYKHINSFFPHSISIEKYKNGISPQKGRIAWCYGDLGILHTFLMSSKILNDQVLFEDSINKLKRISERTNLMETTIEDAGFCHGTAGVAHIYNNIFEQTKNDIFKNTANYWYQQTLDFATYKKDYCGYLFKKGTKGWRPNDSLLVGLAGVGLTLLSNVDSKLHHWDECLLLS